MSRSVTVLALGTAQTLAWASSYYLVAIVADPIGRDLGISGTAVFTALSAALLLSAALGGRGVHRAAWGRQGLGLASTAALLALRSSGHAEGAPVAVSGACMLRKSGG